MGAHLHEYNNGGELTSGEDHIKKVQQQTCKPCIVDCAMNASSFPAEYAVPPQLCGRCELGQELHTRPGLCPVLAESPLEGRQEVLDGVHDAFSGFSGITTACGDISDVMIG